MKRIFCCAYYAGVTLADCPLIARHDMVIMSLYTGRLNNLAVLAEIKRLNPAICASRAWYFPTMQSMSSEAMSPRAPTFVAALR
jgi:hypothetical protein